ncbi:MAG: hypothetical protein HY852_27000 [Bradyrhizobium sp.]|uniref:hypothetical protein n=1 Tax=Bradyrhizobium sp. TaxID=376 RepID=UPI0025C6B676|nr:hypothetical protein [Bradyrhizobium sp.]MBI5265458.1 hypothetical protein [Bradyrhizobium sp.]
MAATNTTSLPSAGARNRGSRARPSSGFKGFWSRFFTTAFHPYRPELHYMRGPGPAWRAKYGAEESFRLKSRDL